MASRRSNKFQQRDIYSSHPQEQRPANQPVEEQEMQVVGDQEEKGQTQTSKRRKNNPNNFFVKKHGK